jgi:hypothetical protein
VTAPSAPAAVTPATLIEQIIAAVQIGAISREVGQEMLDAGDRRPVIALDLDEIERRARAALGKHRWRVYRCSHAGEGEACGIKAEPLVPGASEDAYQRGVVFDTSYDECHHHMAAAEAEHIAASDPAAVIAMALRIRELGAGRAALDVPAIMQLVEAYAEAAEDEVATHEASVCGAVMAQTIERRRRRREAVERELRRVAALTQGATAP